jgi:hypothetical protein
MSANVRVLLFVDGHVAAEYAGRLEEGGGTIDVMTFSSALFAPRPPCVAQVSAVVSPSRVRGGGGARFAELASGGAHYDVAARKYVFERDGVVFGCDEHGLRFETRPTSTESGPRFVASDARWDVASKTR